MSLPEPPVARVELIEDPPAKAAAKATAAPANAAPASSTTPTDPAPTGPPPKLFRAQRDVMYDQLSEKDLVDYGFHLDADIFQYNEDRSQLVSVLLNRSIYLPSEAFKEYTATDSGEEVLSEASAKKLDDWFRLWGKIPLFLEVKVVPKKGFGIFTKQKILKGVFLGYYDGIRHPMPGLRNNPYYYTYRNDKGENAGAIDGRNLTFANFAVIINDGHPSRHNINYMPHTGQILIVTSRDIEAGEELVGPYGDQYWKAQGRVRVD